MSLSALPTELQELIFIYADNDALANSCQRYWKLSQDIVIQSKLLLCRHSILSPFNKHSRHISNDQWVHLVQDKSFHTDIGLCLIIKLQYNDKEFIEVMTEYAAAHGLTDLLLWLTHNAPSSNGKGLPQIIKDRALIQSAMFGHSNNVKILLEAHADPKYDGNAALCMASKYGHTENVRLLLQTDTNFHTDDDYPLCWASRHGHVEIVKLLIKSGANINARRGCALHWAAEHDHYEIVEFLLSMGSDVHSNDDHALRWACVHGHEKIVTLLLKHGADIHALGNYALRNAVKMRRVGIVKILLENGADKTAENDECIRWAASHGDTEILQLLMQESPQDRIKRLQLSALEE